MLKIAAEPVQAPKKKRRTVTSEEILQAKANPNNANVIKSVLQKYVNVLNIEDLDNCGLHALWKTLQYHQESYGQKFTTSLYRFVNWECRRELRRQNGDRKNTVPLSSVGELVYKGQLSDDDLGSEILHVRECMKDLSQEQQSILNERYIQNMTMEEIGEVHGLSKEAIRQKLDRAERRLRELCEQPDVSVYLLSA